MRSSVWRVRVADEQEIWSGTSPSDSMPLPTGLRLFQTFVGELALRVTLVAERLGLGMPHDDEDMVVFFRCFGDFAQLDAHPWLPSRTVCPVWRCGGVVLLPV